MHRSRLALVVLLVLGMIGFAVPAVTLAAGSAGDQQYTDPFGASNGSSKPTATASPPPATTPAPAAATPGTTPSPTAPTAPQASTAAATATAATTGAKSKTLPFTGYDGRLAVLLGAGLLLGGAGLRAALRHR